MSKEMAENLQKFQSEPAKAVIVFQDGTELNASVDIMPQTAQCCYKQNISTIGFVSNYMVKKYGFTEAVKRKYKL